MTRNLSCLLILIVLILHVGFLLYPVLGWDSLTFQLSEDSTSGQDLSGNHEGASPATYNVTLMITNWDGTLCLEGLNVSVHDLDGKIILSGLSNSTGHVDLELIEGAYNIFVKSNGRIVGYQHVYVSGSGVLTIKTWAYALQVTCIDREGRYVPGAIVSLYEQTNTSLVNGWTLVSLAKTDMNGTAFFNNIWNGTYKIVVESGRVIGERTVYVDGSKNIIVECSKASLRIRVVTSTFMEKPLSNATVILQDNVGNIVLRGYTDKDGYIRVSSIYVDSYRIFVDWMNVEVYSGIINMEESNNFVIKSSVFDVSVKVVDLFNRPLPRSRVFVRRAGIGRYSGELVVELETDENGLALSMLPLGTYEISVSSGIYSGKSTVTLTSGGLGKSITIQCNIQLGVWGLILLVSLPLSALSLLLERRRLRRPLEYRRYKNMLMKLESMYNSGLIEYKIYRKLKDEYEAKLMELGGRRK